MSGQSPTESPVPILAYCATCRRTLGKVERRFLGVRLICPNDRSPDPIHIAAVVKGTQGETWLSIEKWILSYERYYTALRWFSNWRGLSRGRHGVFLLGQLGVLLLALTLARVPIFWGLEGVSAFLLRLLAAFVATYTIFDALVERTSVAFVSRFPTHPVRTMLISVLIFVNVALAFGVLYALNGSQFKPELNSVRALYFSFVTISTLGYGDIRPHAEAWAAQLMVVTELTVGLYMVAVILAVFVGWATLNPTLPKYKRLEEVICHDEKTDNSA